MHQIKQKAYCCACTPSSQPCTAAATIKGTNTKPYHASNQAKSILLYMHAFQSALHSSSNHAMQRHQNRVVHTFLCRAEAQSATLHQQSQLPTATHSHPTRITTCMHLCD
jgi:hypothetical protein